MVRLEGFPIQFQDEIAVGLFAVYPAVAALEEDAAVLDLDLAEVDLPAVERLAIEEADELLAGLWGVLGSSALGTSKVAAIRAIVFIGGSIEGKGLYTDYVDAYQHNR